MILRVKNAFDLVDEAHLFDGVERAGDEALAAIDARVVDNLVLGAETALNGIGRAEFAAGVAADAVILVDMDDPYRDRINYAQVRTVNMRESR